MKFYWPCAIYTDLDGQDRPISTYDSALTFNTAKSQIELWRDVYKYDLTAAWVDVYDGSEKVDVVYISLGKENI